MTRRDFQLIAAKLKETHAPPHVVAGLAGALAGTNPKFDRPRFMRASGVSVELVRAPPGWGDRKSGT